jgi:hypothetical protein
MGALPLTSNRKRMALATPEQLVMTANQPLP